MKYLLYNKIIIIIYNNNKNNNDNTISSLYDTSIKTNYICYNKSTFLLFFTLKLLLTNIKLVYNSLKLYIHISAFSEMYIYIFSQKMK